MRAQQFNYLGFGGMAPDERAQSIFLNGDYLHLRWQVAGLVAGWLADAEVPLRHEGRVRGTMDGDLAWGEVLELKSINGRGYEQVVEFGPKEAHKWQGTAYCLCTGYSTVRFVYENKNTQDAVEFAWSPDEEWRAKVLERWSLLNEATDEKRLIPMLHPCLSEKGDAYRWCDFRKICDGAEFPKKVTLK